MPESGLWGNIRLGLRPFLKVLIFLFNTFSWFFLNHRMVSRLLNRLPQTPPLVVWGVYDFAIILSTIVGSFLWHKIGRRRLLYLWIFLGTISSLTPLLFDLLVPDFSLMVVSTISLLLGVSSGLGMPSCLASFMDSTVSENRGSMAGVTFLITNLSTPILISIVGFELKEISLLSGIWRSLAFFLVPASKQTASKKRVSFSAIYHNRSFFLYLIPWFVFSLINGFEASIITHFLDETIKISSASLQVIGAIVGTFSAFVGGLLCDWIGRKRVVIYSFISLGLAYAIVGVVPLSPISWYLHTAVNGIAWGLFTVAFVLILWGDLAAGSAGEKWYAIGGIPFFLADFLGVLFVPYTWVPANAAFSIASFFLFVAVLPLMYAPETLPQRKMELRRLRGYLDEAKKVREKINH